MTKLKALLAKIIERLGLSHKALDVARSRYRKAQARAARHSAKATEAQQDADAARAAGKTDDAVLFDSKARRQLHRAYAADLNAQERIAQIKRILARIDGLKDRRAKVRQRIKDLENQGVTITGNKATGGDPQQRLLAVALKSAEECAAGRRRNFYSQIGALDLDHCITGEAYGERSDCSSWFESVYKSAGCPDPSGNDYTGSPYTGTLEAHGRQVASAVVGCAVLYGPPGATHHVEFYSGPGQQTIGHGSSPVDQGTIDLFGDGNYRFFVFDLV